jgi:hypothetical protein
MNKIYQQIMSLSFSVMGAALFSFPGYAQDDFSKIQIRIEPRHEKVTVVVELAKCRDNWVFSSDYPGSRNKLWSGLAEYVWNGDSLLRADGSCFKKISFTAPLYENTVDRTYPFVIESSMGYAVYAQHVLPNDINDASVIIQIISDECRKNSIRLKCLFAGRLKNNVWLGGSPYVTSIDFDYASNGNLKFIPENNVPAWISEEVTQYAKMTFLASEKSFGAIEKYKFPVFIMFDDKQTEASWRGWSSGRSIFFLFGGKQWLTKTPELSTIVDSFVTHEIIHLWNGWKNKYRDDTPAWMIEGFAEYLSIAMRRDEGRLTDEDASKEVLSSMARCADLIENDSLASTSGTVSFPVKQTPQK